MLSGIWRWRAPATTGDREEHFHNTSVDLLMFGNSHRPIQSAFAQALTERCAEPITGIGKDASEADASRTHPIDLGKPDLGLDHAAPTIDRHPRTCKPFMIACPALRQKQPQTYHHRHFVRRQRHRHRHHCLAVGVLAQCRGILRRDTHRVPPLFWARQYRR